MSVRSTEVLALLDAEGSFATFREAFGLNDDTPWRLPFYVFVARIGDRIVVVDAGVGPAAGEDPFLAERQGRLPEELARHGVDPSDVDLVVLTHLHVDHVGWTMAGGRPFFSNARYVAHRDDFGWVTATRAERPYVRDNVVALHATGRLDLVDGPVEPVPGVRLIRTGGHTPGHCIVDLEDVTVAGDLAVHVHQLADPDLAYVFEEDPSAIAAARRRLLAGFAVGNRVVGLAHLGLGRVARSGDGFAWVPVD
jgi:glyoxylase-like metal-dependent hydrolase (beta-lactamase superfamily II)